MTYITTRTHKLAVFEFSEIELSIIQAALETRHGGTITDELLEQIAKARETMQ